MIFIIYFAALLIMLPPALWVFYLAVMSLMIARNEKRLTSDGLKFGKWVLAIGYVIDLLCNVLTVTLLVLALPRELTVTSRIQKLVDQPNNSYQKRLALWVAAHLLNPFSGAKPHIKLPEVHL